MNKEIIEILSDSEERESFRSKQMIILQKQIEDEASMLKTNTGLLLAVNKQFIEGTPNQKEKVLLERIQKMFIEKFLFNLSTDHFCLKREPNYNKQNCELILNELIVFGTDFWPTRKIKSDAFSINISLQPFKIDQSHTKLKFLSYDDAKRWLEFYAKDNSKVKQKIEQEEVEGMQQQKKQENKLKGWFPLQSYIYQQFERILQARFCTNYQSDIKQLIEDVRTSSYMKFKQQVQSEMLKQEQAKIAYESAQQRKKRQRKFKRNQQFSSFNQNTRQHRQRKQVLDIRKQRKRDKSRNRNKDYHRQRSRDKRNIREYSHFTDFNKQKAQNFHRSYPNQTIEPIQNQSFPQHRIPSITNNILTQIHDDSCNYSFLLESHNDNNDIDKMADISISQAMGQMKIEDNEYADMSVEIRPKEVIQNNHNMSITLIDGKKRQAIDMSIQSFMNNSKEKEDKNKEIEQKKEKYKTVGSEKQRLNKLKVKQSTKSQKIEQGKKTEFDYMQYIEQTENKQIVSHQQLKPLDEK